MPYIGRDLNRGNYLKLDDISSSFNSSTTTFNLTVGGSAFRPGSAFSILVSVGGVIQEPESSYQINNSEITFANAPTAQDSFFCIALAVPIGIGVPGNGTVNGAQIAKPFNYDGFFFLDDANNRVGIGSLQPKQALDVIGNANISGILTASSFSGGSGGINAGVVTCTGLDVNGNGDISGNLVLGGDLTVNGTTTTLDTNLIGVDRIEVGANSSTVVGVAVTQSGTADLVRLYDGTSQVVTIDDEGKVGLGSAIPSQKLDVDGTVKATNFIGGLPITNGADNRVITAASASTIQGESLLTFNGFGLGINDSSGNARLIVSGNSDNGDHDCQIRIYDTDSTTGSQMPNISFWGGSTEIGGIRSTDNQGMKFYTSNGGTLAEKLIIGPQGAVGIGTDHLLANTSVYNKFAVTGDTTSQLAVAKIVRKNNSASNGTYTLEVDSSSHNSNVTNAGAMSVDVNSGRAFTIDGNGKIGIGTASPTDFLEVYSTTDPCIRSRSGSSSVGALMEICGGSSNDSILVLSSGTTNKYQFFRDGSQSDDLRIYDTTNSLDIIRYRHGGYLHFGVNGEERLRITSAGKVGIGTNNPDHNLHIHNSSGDSIVTIESTGNGKHSALEFRRTSSGGDGKGAGSIYVTGNTSASEAIMKFAVGHNVDHEHTPSMVIMGNSEVGIGTDNPQTALEIGKGHTDPVIRLNDPANRRMSIRGPSANNFASVGTETSHALMFFTNGYSNERLRISQDGIIYINNRAPNNSSHHGNIVSYAPSSGQFAYKSLEIGSTNSSSNDTGSQIVGQRKGTSAYPFTLLGSWDNGSACTVYIGGGWGSQSANATQLNFYTSGNTSSGGNSGHVRLSIDTNGEAIFYKNVAVGGGHPWSVTGGNYNNLSISGNDANSSGFLNLGNGAATNNADFDLARIKFHNGATEVATIKATTATSDNGDADIKFFTKKAGAGLKEILRIRNDGFVETMYNQNTGSYNLSVSPTPRIRIRNDYGGDGIISGAQFYAKRGSGAASIFNIGVITTSQDYESNLIIQSRNTDASYSEKIRIEAAGQIRMNYGDNAKQAYALRSTFRTITGHSSTGYQYVRCALMAARTAYRVCVNTTGGNYGPGAQFFTVLRSWDSTTIFVDDKFNMGSAYANAVRMQSDNGGDTWYMEININLTTTSQGFGLSVIPIGNNAGVNTTNLQYYGSNMSNLTNTSSAHSL